MASGGVADVIDFLGSIGLENCVQAVSTMARSLPAELPHVPKTPLSCMGRDGQTIVAGAPQSICNLLAGRPLAPVRRAPCPRAFASARASYNPDGHAGGTQWLLHLYGGAARRNLRGARG
eukprot:4174512-Pleurochrysis_carterae.AAC.1